MSPVGGWFREWWPVVAAIIVVAGLMGWLLWSYANSPHDAVVQRGGEFTVRCAP